ncbi:MAG: alcohol dehydrogenase catalytic domain-containing protein [Candidatus Eremiobacteraeota bacterium]|nr:alcohol dehydrogenase catalytic domain-containing protein [Candidatus Eremiobacteraeota bacterium]
MNTPATMRAVIFYDIDDIRIEERPVPKLRPGELLVQTRASGICSGDVMAWYVRRKAPLVLGHEPAGVVAAVGSGDPPTDDAGRPFAVGDRIFVHHHAPCFDCSFCKRDDYVQCVRWRASKIDPGGLAEYFRVPNENISDTLRLSEGLSFEDGSLIEPLACVVKSLRRARLRADDAVLVIGLGVMGMMHCLLAQSRGAQVFGSDFIPNRREFAAGNGVTAFAPHEAERVLRDATGGRGADITICGPGTAEALRDAIALTAAGGTVLMFTPLEPSVPFTFDTSDLYFRDISLIASYSCGPNDTREALDILAGGAVSAAKLAAQTFPFSQAAQAYRALADAEVLKPIVLFGASGSMDA